MQRLLLISTCAFAFIATSFAALADASNPAWTTVTLDGHQYGIPSKDNVFLPPPFGKRRTGGSTPAKDLQFKVDANREAAKADPSIGQAARAALFMSEAVEGQPLLAVFDLAHVQDSTEMRNAISEASKASYADGIARLPGSWAYNLEMFAIQTRIGTAPLALAACGKNRSGASDCDVTLDTRDGRRIRILYVDTDTAEPSTIRSSVLEVIAHALPETR